MSASNKLPPASPMLSPSARLLAISPKWKRAGVAVILLLIVYSIIFPIRPHRSFRHHLESHGSLPYAPDPSPWSYIPDRDRYNHGLSAEQCDAAFPDLYHEIDRAVGVWKNRRITPHAIEPPHGNDGFVQVLIQNSQLRIIRTRGLFRDDFRHRIHAVLQQLLRALYAAQASAQPLPDSEFTIIVDDIANPGTGHNTALWTFTRQHGDEYQNDIWVIPDFHFFAAPPEASGFEEMQAQSRAHDGPIKYKKPQVVWRGVEWTNPDVRQSLLRVSEGKPWADISAMHWENASGIVSMDTFCNYAFAVNTEGRSWSARMLHILNCDSVPLIHDAVWVTHYYHLFQDRVNCVRVERDFRDLEEKVYYYLNHTDKAQKIVERSINTFRERYTSVAASSCYWRKVVRAWSEIAFKPQALDDTHRRGISYEQFILHRNNEDYPYPPNPS